MFKIVLIIGLAKVGLASFSDGAMAQAALPEYETAVQEAYKAEELAAALGIDSFCDFEGYNQEFSVIIEQDIDDVAEAELAEVSDDE